MIFSDTRRGYFSLMGQFDPEDISRRLEMDPTWSAKTGDANPDTGLARTASLWCFACSEQAEMGLQDQVTYLLHELRPRADAISSLSATFSGTVNLVATLDGRYGNFYLNAGVVIEFASYNVSINCHYFHTNREIVPELDDAN